ncbi:7881_t:CDS:2 [Gigaspora margarita]|uniref:7881_t:CDS:1 n=1 Tax=Gigaspora margarita TaxID=4874 RepID=A0ABN7W1P0_GIGMA|nr:7881_t:CDS:2 [Gigaspora margarita]
MEIKNNSNMHMCTKEYIIIVTNKKYKKSINRIEELNDSNIDTPNESGLKASLLDLHRLKLLPFATSRKQISVEDQIQTELFVLEPNYYESNNKKTQGTIKEDCDSLSAELWSLHSILVLQTITENKLTRYLREQIMHKNQDPFIVGTKACKFSIILPTCL